MKELNNNQGGKKIADSCKKATYLIEKKLIDHITLFERLELKIHLARCSICSVFERQSAAINHMVKALFHGPARSRNILDKKFKQDMQERIEKELNHNNSRL
jgi:hypothetical protein